MEHGSHHTTSAVSVFDVWATYDRTLGKPHYPSYEVFTMKVGSAFSLEGAERIVREVVREEGPGRGRRRRWGLLSLHVKEVPAGRFAPEWQTLSEYIFDNCGNQLDRRTIPYEDCPFKGRSEEGIRFREGDLCEVLQGDRVILGFVAATPPSAERARKAHLDASDDSYVVLTSDDYRDHMHLDSMLVFPPRFKIAPRTEARLRKAYNDYVTLPARLKIADTTAAAAMRETVAELGWGLDLQAPRWPDDTFKLLIRGVTGHPDGFDLQIAQRKAHLHMDRVRISLLRLAGMPVTGRGYRPKRIEPPVPLRGQALQVHPKRYRL